MVATNQICIFALMALSFLWEECFIEEYQLNVRSFLFCISTLFLRNSSCSYIVLLLHLSERRSILSTAIQPLFAINPILDTQFSQLSWDELSNFTVHALLKLSAQSHVIVSPTFLLIICTLQNTNILYTDFCSYFFPQQKTECLLE